MLHLFAMSTVMADGVTIKIGDHVWSFGLNIIIYLLVAAIVGLVAEVIGAIILVALWHLITYGLWHRRSRGYRRA